MEQLESKAVRNFIWLISIIILLLLTIKFALANNVSQTQNGITITAPEITNCYNNNCHVETTICNEEPQQQNYTFTILSRDIQPKQIITTIPETIQEQEIITYEIQPIPEIIQEQEIITIINGEIIEDQTKNITINNTALYEEVPIITIQNITIPQQYKIEQLQDISEQNIKKTAIPQEIIPSQECIKKIIYFPVIFGTTYKYDINFLDPILNATTYISNFTADKNTTQTTLNITTQEYISVFLPYLVIT